MAKMENEVKWTNRATRQLTMIDQRYVDAIRRKVAILKNFPNVELDIENLGDNKYRLRHGDYRIFFEWKKNEQPKIIRIQKIMRRQSKTYKN